jgi:hypothetical protein
MLSRMTLSSRDEPLILCYGSLTLGDSYFGVLQARFWSPLLVPLTE